MDGKTRQAILADLAADPAALRRWLPLLLACGAPPGAHRGGRQQHHGARPLPWISLADVEADVGETTTLDQDVEAAQQAAEEIQKSNKELEEAKKNVEAATDKLDEELGVNDEVEDFDGTREELREQKIKELRESGSEAQKEALEEYDKAQKELEAKKKALVQATDVDTETRRKLEEANKKLEEKSWKKRAAKFAGLDNVSLPGILKFAGLVLLGARLLWGLTHHNPSGCMTVDYDRIVPGGDLSSSDMSMLAPAKTGFFKMSGTGGAGVSSPDACTGRVCSVCVVEKQVGVDKNNTETTMAITAPQVHDFYSNKPAVHVVCPTGPPEMKGVGDFGDDPSWIDDTGKPLADPQPGYVNASLTSQSDCENFGGTWDTANNRCITNCPDGQALVNDCCAAIGSSSGTSSPCVATPTQGGGKMSDNGLYKDAQGDDDMNSTEKEMQLRRIATENHWACRNYQMGQYCTAAMQISLCSKAKTCAECTDGGLANVCHWKQDETHAVTDCKQCPEGTPAPDWKCEAQNLDMAPIGLAPSTAYYHFMIPTLPMPFPKAKQFGPLGAVNPPPQTHPDSSSLPPQTLSPFSECGLGGADKPYGWQRPNIYDINSAEACHSIGGQWEAPLTDTMGFGWGCVQENMSDGPVIMNQPSTLNNVVGYKECVDTYCPGEPQACWKPLYFHGCQDCNSLDMFGLNPSNPLAPVTKAAGSVMNGIGDLGNWLNNMFSYMKYIIYGFILLCLVLSGWCMCQTAQRKGQGN